MISKILLKSFKFTFRVASTLGVVPLEYNANKNKFKVSQRLYRCVVAHLVTLVFAIRAAYIIFALAKNGHHFDDSIRETCLMGLQFVIFGGCLG